MHIDHLHGLELIKDGSGREPGGFSFCTLFQGHLQAVAQEADEDVRFDAIVFLVVDGADVEVVLQSRDGTVVITVDTVGGRVGPAQGNANRCAVGSVRVVFVGGVVSSGLSATRLVRSR